MPEILLKCSFNSLLESYSLIFLRAILYLIPKSSTIKVHLVLRSTYKSKRSSSCSDQENVIQTENSRENASKWWIRKDPYKSITEPKITKINNIMLRLANLITSTKRKQQTTNFFIWGLQIQRFGKNRYSFPEIRKPKHQKPTRFKVLILFLYSNFSGTEGSANEENFRQWNRSENEKRIQSRKGGRQRMPEQFAIPLREKEGRQGMRFPMDEFPESRNAPPLAPPYGIYCGEITIIFIWFTKETDMAGFLNQRGKFEYLDTRGIYPQSPTFQLGIRSGGSRDGGFRCSRSLRCLATWLHCYPGTLVSTVRTLALVHRLELHVRTFLVV